MSEEFLPFGDLSSLPFQEDRRSEGRYRSLRNPFVRLLAKPSFQAYRAVVQDISANGMGLLLDQGFQPGTVLAIQLRRTHQGISCILSGKVIHSTQQPDGSWLVGCSLSRSLTDDEIWGLL